MMMTITNTYAVVNDFCIDHSASWCCCWCCTTCGNNNTSTIIIVASGNSIFATTTTTTITPQSHHNRNHNRNNNHGRDTINSLSSGSTPQQYNPIRSKPIQFVCILVVGDDNREEGNDDKKEDGTK